MTSSHRSPTAPPPPELASVIERNIRAIIDERRQRDRERSLQERVADSITRFAGSMTFVGLHLVAVAVWIAINLGWLGIKPFDPSFVTLAMIASVEAIFISTFVLITQNRMAAIADKRAELDLQISLLAEHEVTHLIRLVGQIAARMGIDAAKDSELQELERDVAPEKVMSRVEEEERRS